MNQAKVVKLMNAVRAVARETRQFPQDRPPTGYEAERLTELVRRCDLALDAVATTAGQRTNRKVKTDFPKSLTDIKAAAEERLAVYERLPSAKGGAHNMSKHQQLMNDAQEMEDMRSTIISIGPNEVLDEDELEGVRAYVELCDRVLAGMPESPGGVGSATKGAEARRVAIANKQRAEAILSFNARQAANSEADHQPE